MPQTATSRRINLTDRAKRYRAQKNVTGPKRCVLCGSRQNLGVMHLDGNEDHGDDANLAWGCKSCNAVLAAAFKQIGAGRPTNQYNPSTGVPSFQQYAWAVSNHSRGSQDEAGAIIHATPKHKRIEYARRIAEIKRSRGTASSPPDWVTNPKSGMTFASAMTQAREAGYRGKDFSTWLKAKRLDDRSEQVIARLGEAYRAGMDRREADDRRKQDELEAKRQAKLAKVEAKHDAALAKAASADEKKLAAAFARGLTLREALEQNPSLRKLKQSNPAKFDRCVKAVQKRGGAVSPYAVCKAALKKRANPADAAADAFEEFHGYAPTELITVTKKVHYHKHLAAAGKLVGLRVRPVDKRLPVRNIEGLGKALLAFNEQKNQLFIEGGDQFLSDAELKKWGIDAPHELETLGKLIAVGYHTTKTHLGKDGGEAVYDHRFKTTNQDGRHIVVTIARYPDLIYRVRDQQFEISGGSYTIRAEGIDV